MKYIKIIFLLFLSLNCVGDFKLYAQTTEGTPQFLPELIISDSMIKCARSNNGIIYTFNQSTNQSELVQVLKNNGIAFKSLGPGQLSTVSIRGTYGASNSFQWEGIDINDALVGTMDFSNYANFSNDQLSLQHNGNGTVGSIINLSHNSLFDSVSNWTNGVSIIQNGLKSFSSVLTIANPNLSSHSEFRIATANNDFSYLYQDVKLRRSHNEVASYNFKQAFDYKLPSNGQMGLRIWLSRASRNIPFVLGSNFSGADQKDNSYRFRLNWKQLMDDDQIEFQLAYINQQLYYNEANLNIAFKGNTNSYIGKFKYKKYISSFWQFNTDLEIVRLYGHSTGFFNDMVDDKGKLKFKLQRELVSRKMSASLFGQVSYAYNKFQTPTYGINYYWRIFNKLSFNGMIERFLQLPSFNDLYWQPGGNINLKAATGWGGELSLSYRSKESYEFQIEFFNKEIKDQIIWLPKNGFFNATNIPATRSRGIELSVNAKKLFHSSLSVTAHYNYTRSTYLESRIPNDDVIGKQLIYIPKHEGTISLKYNYRNIALSLMNNWQGKRYISSDNSAFLRAYHLLDLYLDYKLLIQKKYATQITIGFTNILDKMYQLQKGWPMPGRQWNAQIQIQL